MDNIINFENRIKTEEEKNLRSWVENHEPGSEMNERDQEVAEAADRAIEALGRRIQGKETKEDALLLEGRERKIEQVGEFLEENETKLRALFDHNINAF